MDYFFVEHGPTKWHAQEILMTSDDVTLPTTVPPGSVAYTADGAHTYMYDGSAWVERTTGGGGGGGGASVTTVTETNGTLDMKAGALLEACQSGLVLIETDTDCFNAIVTFGIEDGEYYFTTVALRSNVLYYAESADDYPTTGNAGGGDA